MLSSTITTRGRAHRATALMVVLTAVVLTAVGLAACGAQQSGGADVAGESTASGSGTGGSGTGGTGTNGMGTDLTVVFDDGSGGQQTWTLTCSVEGSPGGDHPDAVNACAALDVASEPFRPVRKDMACTMIYGGAQTATVQGRWNGQDVLATFKRTDGCEIARWDRVAPLVQPGTTGRSSGSL